MKIFLTLLASLTGFLTSGCALLPHSSGASSSPASFSAQGWGGALCEQLNHDIEPQNVGFASAVENIRLYQSWASGFVSGVNYDDDKVYDVSGGTTPDDTFIWLKNYCANHPDTAIPLAIHELILSWRNQGKTLTKPK